MLLALFYLIIIGCSARSPSATVTPTIVTSIGPGVAVTLTRAIHHKVCKPVIVQMGALALPPCEVENAPTIVIDLIVGANGRPLFKRVLHSSGCPELDAAAVEAAERTTFRSGTIDGRPAAMPYRMEFDFAEPGDGNPDLLRMPPGIGVRSRNVPKVADET
jgi:TonB family protein